MATQVFVLVGTNKGAFVYSADAERREWRLTGPHMSGWEVYSLLGDGQQAPGRLFAGTSHMAYGPTLRVSEDLGATWTQLVAGPRYSKESGFSLKRIWQLVPGHASKPGTLFAGVDEAGLFAGGDGGLTWREVNGLTRHPSRPDWTPGGGGLCLHTIVVDVASPPRMWVGISAVGIFRTVDGGEGWRLCNQGLSREPSDAPEGDLGCNVHKLVQDPLEPDTLYVQAHDGLFRSTDAGESWTPFEEGLPGRFGFPLGVTATGDLFAVPVDAGTRCFLDGKLAAYRRRRGSDEWEPVRRGLPAAPHYVGVLRDGLAVDGLEPAGVYFGTTQGDLFYSPDGGENWDRLPGQFSRILTVKTWEVNALERSPS